VPVSTLEEVSADPDDRYEQAIRVLDDATQISKPIMELDNSLMKILSDHALYSLRVYVLFPEGMEKRRDEISRRIEHDLSNID
jgi:hypothetical protein